jgi:heme exporter protein B
MIKALRVSIYRDLLLAMRRPSDVLTAVAFFVIVVTLFPLGIGPEPALLRTIAPGVIWVAALLASMLSLPRMFAQDHVDGTLEQMLLSGAPLGALVLGKVIAHWIVSGLPLVAISPLLAVQYDLPAESLVVLVLSLLIGTPVMSFIGAIGAALTLGLRAAGVLLSILVLPLYVPVLILGTAAVDLAGAGMSVQAHFLLIGALLVIAAAFAPWATAVALRISSE